jgi:endonuclease-3
MIPCRAAARDAAPRRRRVAVTLAPVSRHRGRVTTARAAWRRPSPRRVRAIRDRLRELYGIPAAPPHGRPLDELVLTVLSQSTNDRNRDVAFLRLRARFGSWDAVRDAPLAEVEEAIQPGGLHRQKSVRIQAILRALHGDDLSELPVLGVKRARERLTELPGVGRKTAACVLLFAFGMPDVPVDTHVSRVGTRLGLFRPGAPFEELHDDMLAITPRGQELELHVNLLRHGRRTCHAQRPDCGACALLRMCPYGMELRRQTR